jgi:catechol 2,3-dioxygenase-like lactoylglutathione lyase family enzyme
MERYVDAGEQLVVELYVRDITASCEFYRGFGFEVVEDTGDFVELKWEDALLFLEEIRDAPLPPAYPMGNIRIMVPNVDEYWILMGSCDDALYLNLPGSTTRSIG